jgi:hypothetical protein
MIQYIIYNCWKILQNALFLLKMGDLCSGSLRLESNKNSALRLAKKKSGSVPMARVKPQAGKGAGLSGFLSGFDLKKNLVFGLVFMGAAGAGWGIMSLMREADAPITWQSCLIEQQDGSIYPVMEEIPAGNYEISTSLFGGGENRIMSADIPVPFLVQTEEVTLKNFKQYADYVVDLPESKDKERLMFRLGVDWQKGDTHGSSVNAVSWEGARDYAHWLGQKTGCSYNIPSQDEWVATISHIQSRDQIKVKHTVTPIGTMRNLLWGVREWSRTQCASGYYLLGRDDLTASAYEEQTVCMPAMFSIAGFRVVMNPASNQNLPPESMGEQ